MIESVKLSGECAAVVKAGIQVTYYLKTSHSFMPTFGMLLSLPFGDHLTILQGQDKPSVFYEPSPGIFLLPYTWLITLLFCELSPPGSLAELEACA